MPSNSILAEIAAHHRNQNDTHTLESNEVRLTESAHKQDYFDQCKIELSQAVQELIEMFKYLESTIPLRYGEGTVMFIREYCRAIEKTFYRMVSSKGHVFYDYMKRNEDRREEAIEVRNKSIEIVRYLDQTKLEHQLYEKAITETKLFELIIALENLDPLPTTLS